MHMEREHAGLSGRTVSSSCSQTQSSQSLAAHSALHPTCHPCSARPGTSRPSRTHLPCPPIGSSPCQLLSLSLPRLMEQPTGRNSIPRPLHHRKELLAQLSSRGGLIHRASPPNRRTPPPCPTMCGGRGTTNRNAPSGCRLQHERPTLQALLCSCPWLSLMCHGCKSQPASSPSPSRPEEP